MLQRSHRPLHEQAGVLLHAVAKSVDVLYYLRGKNFFFLEQNASWDLCIVDL